jgi:DNA-binding NtrC family response regulator
MGQVTSESCGTSYGGLSFSHQASSGPNISRDRVSASVHTPPASSALMPPMGRSLKTIAETAVAEAESLAIRQALHITCGKRSEAARLLRIDTKTLYVKMKRYRILGRDFVA